MCTFVKSIKNTNMNFIPNTLNLLNRFLIIATSLLIAACGGGGGGGGTSSATESGEPSPSPPGEPSPSPPLVIGINESSTCNVTNTSSANEPLFDYIWHIKNTVSILPQPIPLPVPVWIYVWVTCGLAGLMVTA